MKNRLFYSMLLVLFFLNGEKGDSSTMPFPPINALIRPVHEKMTFQKMEALPKIDKVMEDVMKKYEIPAVSIAIVKNERLVYVKSYGFADKEANRVASTDDCYRIASVSKPITAITILKLVQDGLISLDQRVFGDQGILKNDYGVPPADSKKDLITIRHLLDHKSGWAKPPHYKASFTATQMLTDLVTNVPLTTEPGSSRFYLNYGYIMLSKVIEQVTGVDYESYVKSNVLKLCGITEMRITGENLNDRLPKEVKYYNVKVDNEDLNFTRSAGAGGWVASATDLARFIVRIDRNTNKPDLISPVLLNQFYFGFSYWFHDGSAPGTSAVLCRLNDKFSFVVLANTRNTIKGKSVNDILRSNMVKQIKSVWNWSTEDLFSPSL